MARLLSRLRKLEEQAGQERQQKFHAIVWKEGRETHEEARQRYVAQYADSEIRDGDLIVFIREMEGCPERPRPGKGPPGLAT